MRPVQIVTRIVVLVFILTAAVAWFAGGGLSSALAQQEEPPVPTSRDIKRRPPAPPPAPSAASTLYDRLGGTYPIAALVDDYLNRLAADQVITANEQVTAALEPRKVPGLKFQITAFVIEAAGGPYSYHGKTMRNVHAGLGITAVEWEASGRVLQATLDHFRIPQREQDELIALVETTRSEIVTGAGARPPSAPQPSGARP